MAGLFADAMRAAGGHAISHRSMAGVPRAKFQLHLLTAPANAVYGRLMSPCLAPLPLHHAPAAAAHVMPAVDTLGIFAATITTITSTTTGSGWVSVRE
jgi:hypothetical protein